MDCPKAHPACEKANQCREHIDVACPLIGTFLMYIQYAKIIKCNKMRLVTSENPGQVNP